MAKSKKRKKSRKRTRGPRLSEAQLVQPTPRVTIAPDQQASDGAPSDLRDEYRYVIADLRRIAIIAAAMMVVMIGLALLAI
ncbi:MAG TPA: hypothetical protein G4O00_00570 [Thermoflexia bacterium]|jgi:hypothetical protein|nr:hypothetical protein [Thermoflexia bacterium]